MIQINISNLLLYIYIYIFSPFDCFAPYLMPQQCAGKNKCTIYFQDNLYVVPICNGLKASYCFIQYQCVPSNIHFFLKL